MPVLACSIFVSQGTQALTGRDFPNHKKPFISNQDITIFNNDIPPAGYWDLDQGTEIRALDSIPVFHCGHPVIV